MIQEIDLSTTDWNNMTPESFNELSEKMLERNKSIKEAKKRKNKEKIIYVVVKLRGNTYSIPSNLVERIQNMKSALSKENLINETINNYSPIQEI